MMPFSITMLIRIRRIDRMYPTNFMFPFFLSSLATVFAFCANILPMYIHINMPDLWNWQPMPIQHMWVLFGFLASLMSVLFFIRTVKGFIHYRHIHWTEYLLALFLLIFLVQWLICVLIPNEQLMRFIRKINRFIPLRYLGALSVIMLIELLWRTFRCPRDKMTIPIRVFSFFFLLREGLDLSAFIFYDAILSLTNTLDNRLLLFLTKDLIYMFLTLTLTFIWLYRYLLPILRTANFIDELDRRLSIVASHRGMTSREKEIARLMVTGKSNKEIGVILDISASTVKNHAYRLYQKLNISSRFELVELIKNS